MPLLSFPFAYDRAVTGESSYSYSQVVVNWSGLPNDVTVKRCYWKFDLSRSSGSVYARWYEYGNTNNYGNVGVNVTGQIFDVANVSGSSGTARIYLGSKSGKTTYTNISFNIEYAYKQSSMTLSATTVEAGKAITANISAQSSTATHTLLWQLGTNSQTQTLAAGVKSSSFTVPLAWIPSATTATATCTLTTLEGGSKVGETQTLSFTVTVNAGVVPSCTVSAALVNGFSGLYLGGRSSVKLTIGNAQAGSGASIKSYKLSGSGYSSTAQTATFGPLNAGTHTFTATVTDSRGRTGTATVQVKAETYAAPTLSGVSIYRSNSAGTASENGAHIALQATASYTALNGSNTLTLQGRYRPVNGAWSGWTAMTSGTRLLLGGALSTTASYEAQIQASDTVGNTASYAALIPTASVTFNLKAGGKGAAFGKYAEGNGLELAADWGFHRDGKSLTPAPRNLLDNSDFTNPVNQRGQTSYTGGVHAIDRWRSSVKSSVLTLNDGYVTFGASGVATQYRQYINQSDVDLWGKTVTVACEDANGTVYCTSGVCPSSTPASNTNLAYNTVNGGMVRLMFDTTGAIYLQIYHGSGTISLRWVALYEGSYTADTLPEYVPKGYGAELVECQQYYRTVYRVYGTSVGNVSREAVVLSPPMRITPTVTQLSEWEGSSGAGYTVQGSAPGYVDIQYTGWGNVTLALSADL